MLSAAIALSRNDSDIADGPRVVEELSCCLFECSAPLAGPILDDNGGKEAYRRIYVTSESLASVKDMLMRSVSMLSC